jgi:hypothetical protein
MSSISDRLRYARLTGCEEPDIAGGGIPLPAVFHDPLAYLMANGRMAPEEVLVKVIRNAAGENNSERVKRVWKTWEVLGRDVLDQLEEGGHVVHRGFTWMLPGDFRGGRIRIFKYKYPNQPDLRITVRSEEERETREALSWARNRMQEYRVLLEDKGLYDGKVKETFDAHLRTLSWEEIRDEYEDPSPDLEEPWVPLRPGPRDRGVITRFGLWYLRHVYPRWVTSKEVAEQFNKMNPDVKPLTIYQPYERLDTLVRQGDVERVMETGDKGRGRPKALFRYVP